MFGFSSVFYPYIFENVTKNRNRYQLGHEYCTGQTYKSSRFFIGFLAVLGPKTFKKFFKF